MPLWAATLRVELEGVQGEPAQNILAYLGMEPSSLSQLEGPSQEMSPAAIRRLYAQSADKGRQALQALGYYNSRIQVQLRQRGSDAWVLRLSVQTGPQVHYRAVDIQVLGAASEEPDIRRILSRFGLKPGQPLVHDAYEQLKNALANKADELGYFDARFTQHLVRVEPASNSADVTLHFDAGIRYRLGDIEVNEVALSSEFLRRHIALESGQYFHSEQLLDTLRSLEQSEYFAQVDVRARRDARADGRVPVQIQLAMKKAYEVRTRFGFGTDTGWRSGVELDNRHWNDKGHHWGLNLGLARDETRYGGYYSVPLQRSVYDELTYSFDWRRFEEPLGEVTQTQLRLEREWLLAQNRFLNGFVGYLFESLDDGSDVIDPGNQVLYTGASLRYRQSDHPVLPNRGYRWRLGLSGTTEAVGSSLDFVQGEIGGKWLRTYAEKHRLLLGFQAGYTLADQADFDAHMPASLRYRAGGDQSVRGYAYRSLGPKDEAGELVGGRHMLVSSVEYEYSFLPDWRLGIFSDWGNAFNDFSTSEMAQGVGIGIRWLLPIGPIKLDLATGKDSPDAYRIHLFMGAEL